MQVLIIRHAPAADREQFALTGQPEELRPLTDKGQMKMQKNVRGLLATISKLQVIACSPFLRALQTADILAQVYPYAHRDTLPALAPLGTMTEILEYLQDHANTSHTIALVGHEPDLGQLATWLLTGHPSYWMPLKKGAACLLEFPNLVEAGQAELVWALTPGQLRQMAD